MAQLLTCIFLPSACKEVAYQLKKNISLNRSHKVKWAHSVVSDSATPWTVAHQALPSMGFSRQEYWSGLPFPSPGNFPTQGSNPGLPHCRQALYPLSHRGSHIPVKKEYLPRNLVKWIKRNPGKPSSNSHWKTSYLVEVVSRLCRSSPNQQMCIFIRNNLCRVKGNFKIAVVRRNPVKITEHSQEPVCQCRRC